MMQGCLSSFEKSEDQPKKAKSKGNNWSAITTLMRKKLLITWENLLNILHHNKTHRLALSGK